MPVINDDDNSGKIFLFNSKVFENIQTILVEKNYFKMYLNIMV